MYILFTMITDLIDYLRKLRWGFLVLVAGIALVAAVANNLRAPEGKSVPWVGGQTVLEKPE